VKIDTAAPTVTGSSFTYDTAQNSLNVTFSEDVHQSIDLADVLIQPILPGGGLGTGFNPVAFDYDPNTNTAKFYLSMPLADGNYRATIGAGSLTDVSGNGIASAYQSTFFSLMADANRDGVVDSLDFTNLALNFNKSGMSFADGDFNHDGIVNALDFNALATNYGASVPAMPAPAIANSTSLASATAPADLFSNSRIKDWSDPDVSQNPLT
jgi:hypothetical protein